MGQAVVGQQSKEPGGRSRLWLSKDIFHVLKEKTGTPTVEGIVLDLLETKEVECHPEAFYQMVNLRLLKVHNVRLPEGLNRLPNSLRFLEWGGYPLQYLPSGFDPDELVELSMCHSRIEQLWNGKKGVPYAEDGYEIVMPGKEIPGWFTHQRMGPEVSVDLTPQWR
ncbi:disease resistance protein RPP2A-like isoform X2 [Malus domestica]|uniref:disease resistance protein RPP2A-like isoform X2 n=1 Tax=Malus domestica TaxID=3750 RepID=UPI0010AB0B8F|nr:disease resistance protein RPP2A-like isoform X2 [Malus domestica]